MYKKEMGELISAKRTLRAMGAMANLDVNGMFCTTVTTSKGATSRSWVYVLAGNKLETLLGDKDADKLGIIYFTPEGREPIKEERGGKVRKLKRTSNKATNIPSKLREAGVNIKTGTNELPKIKRKKRKGVRAL